MLVTLSAPLPLLVSVAVCATLVVPTACVPKVRLVVDKVTAPADAVPVPVRLTACGLLLALSVTVTFAVRTPVVVGLKLTVMVQLAPAAKLVPQDWLPVKSPALAPVRAMLVILSAVLPGLVRVAVCEALVVPTTWLPKLRLAGDKVTVPATVAPVPLRATLCGLPVALSLMLSEALRVPAAAGVKVTAIAQLIPAASELPQVLV